MVHKFGNTEEQILFYHPLTNKHLGLAKIVFELVSSAQAFVNKYNGTSVMGKVLRVFLDPFGKECKRIYQEFTVEKRQSLPEEKLIDTPTEVVSETSNFRKESYSHKDHEKPVSEREFENDYDKSSSKSWDRERRSDKESYHRKYKSDRDRDHWEDPEKDKEVTLIKERDLRIREREPDIDREPPGAWQRNFKSNRDSREFSTSSVKSDSVYTSSTQSDVSNKFTNTSYNSSTNQSVYDPYFTGG